MWMVRGTVWQTVRGSENVWMVRITVWQTVRGLGNVWMVRITVWQTVSTPKTACAKPITAPQAVMSPRRRYCRSPVADCTIVHYFPKSFSQVDFVDRRTESGDERFGGVGQVSSLTIGDDQRTRWIAFQP